MLSHSLRIFRKVLKYCLGEKDNPSANPPKSVRRIFCCIGPNLYIIVLYHNSTAVDNTARIRKRAKKRKQGLCSRIKKTPLSQGLFNSKFRLFQSHCGAGRFQFFLHFFRFGFSRFFFDHFRGGVHQVFSIFEA